MLKNSLFTAFIFFFLSATNIQAQHEHHQPEPAKKKSSAVEKPNAVQPPTNEHKNHQPVAPDKTAADSTHMQLPVQNKAASDTTHSQHMHGGHGGSMGEMPGMTHAFSRSLPMNRNGSGTAWNPDETPMYMYMKHAGNWNMMFHGSVYLRYTSQDLFNAGSRGDSKLDAPNWFMAMIQRPVGKRGLFNFNAMLSLDPITEGKAGYPLLFQSGETYKGQRLVDRQHPHDLFSELSVAYTHQLNPDVDITGYFGLPGEPALGPVAFMHRISSFNNPDAGLGHHWQDATHITFGVATLGVRYKKWKLEGSSFTGREPNENRFGIDKPLFDSYSYRLNFNPTRSLAMQVSRGFIHSPEALEPETDVNRTAASVLHSKVLGADKHLTSALIWGLNDAGPDHREHSILAESNLQVNKTGIYGRYEWIQKTPEELSLTQFEHDERFNVHALTLGTSRIVARQWNTDLSIGLQGTVYAPGPQLKPIYGKVPVSGEIYLRINPSLMRM